MSTIPQKSFPQRLQEGFRNFGSALEDRIGALNLFQKKQTPKTAETLLKRAQELLLTTRTLEEYKVGSKDDHSLTKKKLDFTQEIAVVLFYTGGVSLLLGVVFFVLCMQTFGWIAIIGAAASIGLCALLYVITSQIQDKLATQQEEEYNNDVIKLRELAKENDEIKFEICARNFCNEIDYCDVINKLKPHLSYVLEPPRASTMVVGAVEDFPYDINCFYYHLNAPEVISCDVEFHHYTIDGAEFSFPATIKDLNKMVALFKDKISSKKKSSSRHCKTAGDFDLCITNSRIASQKVYIIDRKIEHLREKLDSVQNEVLKEETSARKTLKECVEAVCKKIEEKPAQDRDDSA